MQTGDIGFYRHRNLGIVEIDVDCCKMQDTNGTDLSSVFVLHDGEIKEVTKDMLTPLIREYLGDSVYAEFDGNDIILTTENGAGGPSNTIILDSSVLFALKRFMNRIL